MSVEWVPGNRSDTMGDRVTTVISSSIDTYLPRHDEGVLIIRAIIPRMLLTSPSCYQEILDHWARKQTRLCTH